MKVLLIDDERLARTELRRLLEKHPDIEIVGEARDSEEALAQIARLEPELLLLKLPGRAAGSRALFSREPKTHFESQVHRNHGCLGQRRLSGTAKR
jgi:DNA-binding NarL/FixJ family response regulator